MKIILLIRHAKSDWSNTSLSDFDRPLNERGKRDAPMMADRITDRKIRIDNIVSSPAKRASKTAGVFAKTINKKKQDIILKDELYGASPEDFYNVIHALNDKDENIAIFSHNPGITDFANMLTETRIDNIPTCGIFAVAAHCNKWTDFKVSSKDFLFFDYPKASA